MSERDELLARLETSKRYLEAQVTNAAVSAASATAAIVPVSYINELEKRAAEQMEWEAHPKCEDNGVGSTMMVIANELKAFLTATTEKKGTSAPVEAGATGWISVKDRLPGAELEWVLVAAEFDGPGDWRIKIGALDSDMPTGWKILGASWTPTHWMPLPDAPDVKRSQP